MTKIYCTYCKTATHADTSCPYQLKDATMATYALKTIACELCGETADWGIKLEGGTVAYYCPQHYWQAVKQLKED